jgi:glycosyltransferase involved in cell wall biosynthesis
VSANTPTILQVIPELDAGGAELTTLEVAEAIVRGGGRAIIVTRGGRWVAQAEALGAEVLTRDVETKNPLTLMGNARWLRTLITTEGVTLIHARSRAPAWSAEWAARRSGIPFVTTYHGAYSEKGPVKRAYNAVMARGDTVIANSDYIRDLVQQRYGTPDDRLVVIERGVDLKTYTRDIIPSERIEGLRAQWGAPPDVAVILHPARLTRWKGQLTVIAAAARLPAHIRARTRIILAGDAQGRDAYVDELKREIAEHNLEDVVVLAGHVTDMPAAYAAAKVVLIASTEPEAFGRTSAEAQAVGVPVIATAIGAPKDTVLAPPAAPEENRTGWLVPPADADALAEAMTEALAQPETAYAALAARASAHARRRFSTEKLQTATLGVYDRLIGSRLEHKFRERVADLERAGNG